MPLYTNDSPLGQLMRGMHRVAIGGALKRALTCLTFNTQEIVSGTGTQGQRMLRRSLIKF